MRPGIGWMGRGAAADVPFMVIGVPFRRIIGGIGFVFLYSFKGYAGFLRSLPVSPQAENALRPPRNRVPD
jgi:hypothetical protein